MNAPGSLEAVESAIWRQDPGALSELPQVDPSTWAGSAQFDCKTFGLTVPLPYPVEPSSGNTLIAVVMMVKDEEDIIGPNLDWLYHIGIRRFVLGDNQSSDNTRAVIDTFTHRHPTTEIVVITDPLVSYVQSLKTTGMLRFALSIWPDLRWIFPIDADEFLVPVRGFGPLLSLPPEIEALTIPKVIHSRHTLGGEPDTGSPLGLMALRNPPFCVPPKSACLARLDLTVTGGNHTVRRIDGSSPAYQSGFAIGFYYREFQTRSFAHFVRKVRNGGRAILAARAEGRSEGGDHWLQWHSVLEREGEDGLRQVYQREAVRGAQPHWVMDPFHGAG